MILFAVVCHNTLASQTTDRQTDRQHLMTIAELTMRLQRSANITQP